MKPPQTRRSIHGRRAFMGTLAAGAAYMAGSRGRGMPFLENPLLAQDLVYQCPMDPDVRSNVPGVCPRCGMTLRSGIPEPIEFPMEFSINPKAPKTGEETELTFSVLDPQNSKQVSHFQIVHEKLFHLFIVSSNMTHFVHDHPVLGKDGKFRYTYKFPEAGLYRLLGDFFPDGATPQLAAKTVIVPGGDMQNLHLTKNYAQRQMTNMGVSLTSSPEVPLEGTETRLFTHLTDSNGLEKYLGAWCHMLAASDDLIDLIHSHPFVADGGPEMRFDVYFPRARGYRVWFQWQKSGVIDTTYFDIPVLDVETAAASAG
jgi:hypothetical protein